MMVDLHTIIGLIVGGVGAVIIKARQIKNFLTKIVSILETIVNLSKELEKTAEDIQEALADEQLTPEEIEQLKNDIKRLRRTCELLSEYIKIAKNIRKD